MRQALVGLWIRTMATLSAAALCLSPAAAQAQRSSQDITCQSGHGEYRYRFSTGVSVEVAPIRHQGFAERSCSAKLAWKGQQISIADDADQVGIDALGADLGFGKPVAALQIDESGRGLNRTYQIYSLATPPRLLYTIKGASSYRAADTDMDGHVEIWADDLTAVNGFEHLPAVDLDSPPTVVLRFEKGRLFDVGSQVLPFYDAEITRIRSQLSPVALASFKQSDGKLTIAHQSSAELHQLIRTKIGVLEIVWAYLYSGREQEAWANLTQLWPPEDVERIRAAIAKVHESGILQSVDHTRHAPPRKHFVKIYDAVDNAVAVTVYNPAGGAPDTSQVEMPVTQPKSILLRRPPPSADRPDLPTSEVLELVVDVAGKVHSAKVIGRSDEPLIKATEGWQFIPAFRDGRPVVCRFRLSLGVYK